MSRATAASSSTAATTATSATDSSPADQGQQYQHTSSSSSSSTSTSSSSSPSSSPLLLKHPAVVYANKSRLLNSDTTSNFKSVHVFDFDQTLFRSPMPNPSLWDASFIGTLISWNTCGTGWWHNSATLNLGPEAEANHWEGWWNEDLIQEIEKSNKDEECLTVLLTGRSLSIYKDQLLKMVQAKQLQFDLIAMKPSTVARIQSSAGSGSRNGEGKKNDKVKKREKAATAESAAQRHKEPREEEIYRKIHTFSIKQEFLYSVLFEYPTIRHMQIWDDRIGQIQKFKAAAELWTLHQQLLETCQVHTVQLSHRYMDRVLEKQLVLKMIEDHNRQVELEAQGGPFWTIGSGEMPQSARPNLDWVWSPREMYVAQPRSRLEIVPIVQYTGVLFDDGVQTFLKNLAGPTSLAATAKTTTTTATDTVFRIKLPESLQGRDIRGWDVPTELHVTLCLGIGPQEYMSRIGGLGATVLVELEAVGEWEGKVWALKVKGFDSPADQNHQEQEQGQEHKDDENNLLIVAPDGQFYSTMESLFSANPTFQSSCSGRVELWKQQDTPHITMAYDRFKGTKPVAAKSITRWESLVSTMDSMSTITTTTPSAAAPPKRIVLVGTIGEKRLAGVKVHKRLGHLATPPRAEVDVPQIVKQYAIDKKIELPGRKLGAMIKQVQEEMIRLSLENRAYNRDQITALVHAQCDTELK
ncbi:hypothetical protein EDD11_005304 [Mortierella claussenii]|nr:hypothetical protein EDD11_005304 [Mortierella claussenii]